MTRWAPPWRRKRTLCPGSRTPVDPVWTVTCPACHRMWDTEDSTVPDHPAQPQHRKRARAT